jgi:PAS domain S-box-containing protein
VNAIPLSPEFMQSLREAHETYRHLVEGIPAILYIDANDDLSTNIYTSPQILEILGFTADEWREDPSMWLIRMHDDDRERVVREHQASNVSGFPFRSEYRIIAADGREVWFRDEAILVRADGGRPLFWRGIMLDITEQKQVEEKLRKSLEVLRRTLEDRRRLLRRLEQAQEEERRRIAADIHDDSIQVISAADIRAQTLARRLEDPELRAEAEELHATMEEAVSRLRHLLIELRPPALDREGLVAALRLYLGDASGQGDLASEVQATLEAEPLPEVRATLFRIAQEAITNARKHAHATHLSIVLTSEDDGFSLRVSDDGKGFEVGDPAGAEPGHIGVPTMIERAELAGGWCRLRSAPGEGTTVECWLPAGSATAGPDA